MGMDAGAADAFGLYLLQFDLLTALYKELQNYVGLVRDGDTNEHPDGEPNDFERISEFRTRFVEAFAKEYNIIIPPNASLIWMGNEDDRPARCDTPSEEWILGWGLLTKPWDYPERWTPPSERMRSSRMGVDGLSFYSIPKATRSGTISAPSRFPPLCNGNGDIGMSRPPVTIVPVPQIGDWIEWIDKTRPNKDGFCKRFYHGRVLKLSKLSQMVFHVYCENSNENETVAYRRITAVAKSLEGIRGW